MSSCTPENVFSFIAEWAKADWWQISPRGITINVRLLLCGPSRPRLGGVSGTWMVWPLTRSSAFLEKGVNLWQPNAMYMINCKHTQTHIYIHKCAHFNLHMQPAIYWPSHSSLSLGNKQEQHVGISLVMEFAAMTTAATTTIFIILACECVSAKKNIRANTQSYLSCSSVTDGNSMWKNEIFYFIELIRNDPDMCFLFSFNSSFSGLTFIPRLRTLFTANLLAHQLRN